MSKPTESELEILAILWELKEASVREVHERLAATKETGYTTTLKIMQIMHAKGMLLRDEASRSHLYRPVVQQGETQKSLVKNLLSIAFGGSSTSLAMQALGQEKPSKEELKEIRAFLDQLEQENR